MFKLIVNANFDEGRTVYVNANVVYVEDGFFKFRGNRSSDISNVAWVKSDIVDELYFDSVDTREESPGHYDKLEQAQKNLNTEKPVPPQSEILTEGMAI